MLHDETPSASVPDWLARLAPADWIKRGLAELQQAESRLAAHDRKAGILGLQRAAGMALNGALSIVPRPWGRSYVEHLRALPSDSSLPEPVRDAARLLGSARADQTPGVVRLTPPSESARWVEATKTIMAHAYAVVHGGAGRSP